MKPISISLGTYFFTPPWWGVVLALVTVALFCRLGMWQIARAHEKEIIMAHHASRQHMPAMSFTTLQQQRRDIEDIPVQLQGTFFNQYTIYQDQNYQGRAGFYIYTVFMPQTSNKGILVNRGWLPVGADMQKLPPVPLLSSTQIHGRVALPSRYFIVGEPNYQQRPLRVSRLDMPQLSQALGVALEPFFLRLESPEKEGLHRDWSVATRLGMTPDKHRAYAFQWFSLAAAVGVVFFAVNLHKKQYDDINT